MKKIPVMKIVVILVTGLLCCKNYMSNRMYSMSMIKTKETFNAIEIQQSKTTETEQNETPQHS